MPAYGLGSKVSPIIISDDDDEDFVSRHLLQERSNSAPLQHDAGATPPEAPKSMKMMLNMGYTPGLGLGRELDGEFCCHVPYGNSQYDARIYSRSSRTCPASTET